ncbi:PP2C family protein-serine/threonine phosphatase [Sphingomonas radiodurans]|uniref:PP2C family protein-serine/threonine phosphatase n=1 Tax=Sphingomonas radiodurans TaxID=2890321 RepID=UPI001E600450|nr:protein phosphatase 2C domain-containing protein [Sphingomonas radiodurans]WBH16682.1 protein phosphatase 2C domain-containing protein [Sphingomonas radiodurans]
MIPLKTEWYASTDVGAVREVNEDRFLASDDLGLWLVADGMGGMARGDWAATQVIDAVSTLERKDDLPAMLTAAADALHHANEQILAESAAKSAQMGTTAVLLVVRGRSFGIVWVGDSRGYLVRDRRLHRLTRDHSQVQELVDRGLLDDAGAAVHPLRNVLTRAVGVTSPLAVDSVADSLQPDDLLLLCSDGLYGVIGEAEMEAILAREPIASAGPVLIRRCHELGAPDNITMIAVVVAEATLIRIGGTGPAS